MFVYLSKKIAIPNNVKLNSIAWNKEHGYIAVAGSGGLLKVLKLEHSANGRDKSALAAVSNLSMNQTLDGHKESVMVVTWNENQQKLTSSDTSGVIVVWSFYKGTWYEEMTNDRKKSTVKGMSWTSDGNKICIVYEDGAIIVGSVDGNRIWGKELKNTHLSCVQWSPDNRLILFGLTNDETEYKIAELVVKSVFSNSKLMLVQRTNITDAASSMHMFRSRKVQIMRSENDESPIIFDTSMRNINAKWNCNGSIIAICGQLLQNVTTKDCNQVSFYSPFGQIYRTLAVPGNDITSISWEARSLRIAMAVDSFIYFANIRPDYVWCYFQNTVVFLGKNQHDSTMNVITFWNIVSNQSFLKETEPAICMAACNDHCVIGVECINTNIKDITINALESKESCDDKKFQLLLCNSIGTTVDSKYTEMKPKLIGINSNFVVIASDEEVMLWRYQTPKSFSNYHGDKKHGEKRFHIDDTPTGVDMSSDLSASVKHSSNVQHDENKDVICALAISEKLLLVGRSSGVINEYSLPSMALKNHHKTNSRPHKLSINCNSTRASIINHVGTMTVLELNDEESGSQLKFSRVERKDIWDTCWAKDNPLLLALMEKARMYIFRGDDPEEPVSTSGYLCTFQDLEITSVLLDDIISGEETQNPHSHIIQLRIKSLRDTDDLLQHVGLEDAKQFIEDNPHPRLWRLLGENALKKLELEIAEKAFISCANYHAIQLIKRLRNIPSEILKKAEIFAFFGEYEEAEKLYIEADRRDLAINLRITLCDWFRVVQLYRMGTVASDQQIETAWREIGKHFANLGSWESAKEYFIKSHHIEGLIDALYKLEQFDDLEKCIEKLPDKSSLLSKIAEMFVSVGMCREAVAAYIKLGDHKSAVDTCINLCEWGEAVELAEKYQMHQISVMLSKHAAQLIKAGRLPEAVELQRKAGRHLDAARLLIKFAELEVTKRSSLIRIKKLYILAGLLVEEHIALLGRDGNEFNRNAVLNSMQNDDVRIVEHIWHCAEAYHFMLLAQRQLRYGIVHSAVITALRLRDYEDVLCIEDIYTLLALASCADRSFGTCSKAFIKLESLETLTNKVRCDFEELAVNIFSKNNPTDNQLDMVICYSCQTSIPDCLSSCSNCGTRFPPCISSGKPITQPINDIWICGRCHHCASLVEIKRYRACPLCHNAILTVEK